MSSAYCSRAAKAVVVIPLWVDPTIRTFGISKEHPVRESVDVVPNESTPECFKRYTHVNFATKSPEV